MKQGMMLLMLIAAGCSSGNRATEEKPSPPAASNPAPAAPVDAAGTAQGEPFDLRIDGSNVLFCDTGGGWKLDLQTGKQTASGGTCGKPQETNSSCSSLGIDVSVRSPGGEPNDIVDVAGSSFPMKGKVQDCAAEGKFIGVVTADAVTLIDAAKGSASQLSAIGGGRVALGSGWVAWSEGLKIRTKKR